MQGNESYNVDAGGGDGDGDGDDDDDDDDESFAIIYIRIPWISLAFAELSGFLK